MFALHKTSYISTQFYFILNKYENRKKTVITFPVIDRVCYKVAKENRRKEQRRTNKTDIFSTNNSTQNG